MRLLYKTSLYLLLAAVPVGVIGGWLQYRFIHAGMLNDVDEQLGRRLSHLTIQLRRDTSVHIESYAIISDLQIQVVDSSLQKPPTFSSIIKKGSQKKAVKVRVLQATIKLPGRTYLVTLKQVYDEIEIVIWDVSVSVILIFLFLLSLFVIVMLIISRSLWKPFYRVIEQLRNYRIDKPFTNSFSASTTREFDELSRALTQMTKHANQQFTLQRQFAENASHEIQTPITIALTNLDTLMQASYIETADIRLIQNIQDSMQRLSSLSKGLLLLTKIENNQFSNEEVIDVSALLNELIVIYNEFAYHRGIHIHPKIAEGIKVRMHGYLSEILFTNLINNSLKHNQPDGYTRLELTESYFCIQNTGDPLSFPPERIFDRFVKNSARQESTGLGLALVKEIANLYQMDIRYSRDEKSNLHEFRLVFTAPVL